MYLYRIVLIGLFFLLPGVRVVLTQEVELQTGDASSVVSGAVPEAATDERDDGRLEGSTGDSLVGNAQAALRRYVRSLFDEYDADGNYMLNEQEWSFLPAGQALDLNGDLELDEEELLYYLVRYAENRTIYRPVPPVTAPSGEKAMAGNLIRPLSAPLEVKEEEVVVPEVAVNPADGNEVTANEEEQEDLSEVSDPDLLSLLTTEREETVLREYAVTAAEVKGVPRWFLVRDANGDGQLSLRELAPSLSVSAVALFGQLDQDSDGFVTPDEIRNYLQSRKK